MAILISVARDPIASASSPLGIRRCRERLFFLRLRRIRAHRIGRVGKLRSGSFAGRRSLCWTTTVLLVGRVERALSRFLIKISKDPPASFLD